VSRKEDGVVDNKVSDSTGIIKLQRVDRRALVAMDTSFYTTNLVMHDEGCQFVLADGME